MDLPSLDNQGWGLRNDGHHVCVGLGAGQQAVGACEL